MRRAPIIAGLSPNHDKARVIQVVETTLVRRGRGIEGDPIRIITQYWSMDGELLAEVDPCADTTSAG